MGGYFEGFARFPRISIQAVYRESDRLTIIKIKKFFILKYFTYICIVKIQRLRIYYTISQSL